MTHRRLIAGTAVLASLLLVGCDSGSSSVPRPQHSLGSQHPLGKDRPPRGPVSISGAVKGGTLTVLGPRPFGRSAAAGLVVRTLVQRSIDPRSGRSYLAPDLSIDTGLSNDLYDKWRFEVRRGAEFQDGTPVTASDVVRGLRHCLAQTPTRPCRRLARHRPRISFHRDTIRIVTARPFERLRSVLASPVTGPLPRGGHALATGPYRVLSSRPDRVVLTRNRDWDPGSDPVRTSYPDRYVFRRVADGRISSLMRRDALALDAVPGRDHGPGVGGFRRDSDGKPVWWLLWVRARPSSSPSDLSTSYPNQPR